MRTGEGGGGVLGDEKRREYFTSFCLLPFVDGDKTERERRRSTGKREIDMRKPRNRFPATFVSKPLISGSILSSVRVAYVGSGRRRLRDRSPECESLGDKPPQSEVSKLTSCRRVCSRSHCYCQFATMCNRIPLKRR